MQTHELLTLNHGWKEMAESDGDEDGCGPRKGMEMEEE